MKRIARILGAVCPAILCLLLTLAMGASAQKHTGVTINVVMQVHNATEALADMIPEFERETGIKVNLDRLPQAEMTKKAEAAFAAKAATYDVIQMMIVAVSRYARAGWVEPLDKFIAASPETDVGDFMSGFWGSQIYKGNVYGLPFYGESSLLMYKKDLLKKAGLQVPATMDELKNAAGKLTGDGIYGIAMRGARGQAANGYIWPTFLRAFGGKFFDENLRPVFNSKEGFLGTEFYADLLRKSGPPGVVNMSWNEVQVLLQQGQVAMAIDATNWPAALEVGDVSKVAGKIGYAAVPKGPAGRFTTIAVASLGISAFSSKKQAAWEFIKWATSKEVQLKCAMGGLRPDVVRDSVFLNETYRKVYGWDGGNWYRETQAAMRQALPDYRPVYLPEWPAIGDAISIHIQSILSGTKGIKQALDDAARDVAAILHSAGYY